MENNSSDFKSCESSKITTYVSKSDQRSFDNNFNKNLRINDQSNEYFKKSLLTDSAFCSLEDKFSFSDSNFYVNSTDKSLTNNFYDSSMNNDFNFKANNFNANYSSTNDSGFSMKTDDLSDIFAGQDDYKDSGHCEEFDEVEIANITKCLGNHGKEMKEMINKNTFMSKSSKQFTFKMPAVATVNMISSESSTELS